MKVLVATKKGQGKRVNDFCFVPEGELVKYGMSCEREEIDGECGCRRSMIGVKSHKATTTFTVKDEEHTPEDLLLIMLESDKNAGWDNSNRAELEEMTSELLRIAASFPIGTILERRGNRIFARTL